MDFEAVFVAPLILFMIFVAPIWVIMHYRAQRKMNEGLSSDELAQLQELAQQGEKMRERIRTLESILDAESPEWRNRG